jgi:HD-GYP domain-containing protein (c-di-GMP phosphodiesterase class II)
MSPSVAIGSIVERAGAEFDPKVVEAFVAAFQHGRAQTVVAKS